MDDTCIACEIGTMAYQGCADLYVCTVCGFSEDEFERRRRLAMVGEAR